MKILIDQNNLLTIENPNIHQLKEYNFIASGYRFSDYDKWIIVYHKKEFKIINLKNLWESMNVFHIIKREDIIENILNQDWLITALTLFRWFDENTWESYFFIPRMKEVEMKLFNSYMEKLNIDISLTKSEKGIIVNKKSIWDIKYEISTLEWYEKIFSFLFGLVLIYGKMDIKNWEIIWIKSHIPLFGQYVQYKDSLDAMIQALQEDWIFLNHSIVQNGDWIIYQITSSDYELLWSFINFYQSVEKLEKIHKRELTEKVKSQLIAFIDNNEQIPENWKEEVLKMIEDGIMKLLLV